MKLELRIEINEKVSMAEYSKSLAPKKYMKCVFR